MRQITYKYHIRGFYQTEDDTAFAGESQLKIVAEPHDFSIAVGKEVLRSSSFCGCTAVASCDGEVVFYDSQGDVIGRAEKGETCYQRVRFAWKPDKAIIEFGRIVTVDYYPNCDGEHDRWGEEWETQRAVALHLHDNGVETV